MSIIDRDDEEQVEEKTPEQLAAEAAALAESQKPQGLTEDRLNEMLGERDNRLMQGMQQTIVGVMQTIMQNNPQQQHQPTQAEIDAEAEKAQTKLGISPEEFWRNPEGALQKFYETKVAPALKVRQPQGQPDNSGMVALAETRVQGLYAKMSEDEKKTYGSYLQQVLDKTDIRVLADPKGIDSVWRLTKSYADDHIREEATKRSAKNQSANMFGGQGGKAPDTEKVVLQTEEAEVAAKMGISPEHYKKYSVVEEVMPGQNRKKK